MKKWIGALLGGAVLGCSLNAFAGVYGLNEISTERLKEASRIAPRQIDGAFGDKLSLYSGGVTFENVDVSLPGHGPAVEFRRSKAIQEDRAYSGELGGLGDWNIEIPSISGVFTMSHGWAVEGPDPAARCSKPDSPVSRSADFEATKYWDGNTLSVPGQVNEKLLIRNSQTKAPAPTNGKSYPQLTRNGWVISCEATAKNGYGGEAFVATSPDGTQYRFDWVVKRRTSDLSGFKMRDVVSGGWMKNLLYRERVFFLVSQVKDRHGNTVDYRYEDDRLVAIEGSDGRAITIGYVNGYVVSVTAAGKTYNYSYSGTQLSQVEQPDGSTWTYADPQAYVRLIDHFQEGEGITQYICLPDQFMAPDSTVTVKNPSNAIATFTFKTVRHGRVNVPERCLGESVAMGKWNTYWMIPLTFDAYSLVKKDISGPGVEPGTWTYAYPPKNHPGGWEEQCTANPQTCQLSKQVIVTGPQRYEVHEFGIWWDVNDGQLLSTSVGTGPNDILTKSTTVHVTEAEAAALSFGSYAGGHPAVTLDHSVFRHSPVREQRTEQQGVTFKSVTNTWDAFARPLSQTRSSTISGVPARTDVTAYHDDLALWVTGQVASVTNTNLNKVLKLTTYNAEALPLKVYAPHNVGNVANQVPEQTFAYYADGNVSSVADGAGNAMQYFDWTRGVPERIKMPPTADNASGAEITSEVASDGTITWVKGEAGDLSCYTYDEMGRTASIKHGAVAQATACDVAPWTPTTQQFVQSATQAFELPVGHWQQTVSTGTGRTVIYFDAFWRPVVEESYDEANKAATRSLVVKRYDDEGRLVFQSYPMATLTDYRLSSLKGVHTQYDALGRVVSVAQDSEFRDAAGAAVPLVTTTAYLSGFRTQMTNPNGKKTITGFFAQGEPSTELPAWMDQPEGVFTTIERDALGNPKKVTRSGPGG